MSDVETLKAEVRKLTMAAVRLKMNLHDLAEDLPLNWEQIPTVAQQTFEAYRELEARRAALQTSEIDAAAHTG